MTVVVVVDEDEEPPWDEDEEPEFDDPVEPLTVMSPAKLM